MTPLKGLDMRVSEADRVQTVKALQIMATPAEPEFDRLARLAGHITHSAYAHICFIDDAHQFKKAMDGIQLAQVTRRDESVCAEMIETQAPVLIPNLEADARERIRVLKTKHEFGSYAGVPVHWMQGQIIGAIGTFSKKTGSISEQRLEALEACAELVTRELLIRKAAMEHVRRAPLPATRQAQASPDILKATTLNHLSILQSVNDGIIFVRHNGTIHFVNRSAEQILECSSASLLGSSFSSKIGLKSAEVAGADDACPVVASLRDGRERLSQRAEATVADGVSTRIDYVVSPVVSDTRTIGAAIIFRKSQIACPSNGIELRTTLHEINKLKVQLARLEVLRIAESASSLRLPELGSGEMISLEELIRQIQDEYANQSARSKIISGGRVDGHMEVAALPGPRANGVRNDWLKERSSAANASRIERWMLGA